MVFLLSFYKLTASNHTKKETVYNPNSYITSKDKTAFVLQESRPNYTISNLKENMFLDLGFQ